MPSNELQNNKILLYDFLWRFAMLWSTRPIKLSEMILLNECESNLLMNGSCQLNHHHHNQKYIRLKNSMYKFNLDFCWEAIKWQAFTIAYYFLMRERDRETESKRKFANVSSQIAYVQLKSIQLRIRFNHNSCLKRHQI